MITHQQQAQISQHKIKQVMLQLLRIRQAQVMLLFHPREQTKHLRIIVHKIPHLLPQQRHLIQLLHKIKLVFQTTQMDKTIMITHKQIQAHKTTPLIHKIMDLQILLITNQITVKTQPILF